MLPSAGLQVFILLQASAKQGFCTVSKAVLSKGFEVLQWSVTLVARSLLQLGINNCKAMVMSLFDLIIVTSRLVASTTTIDLVPDRKL